MSPTVSINLCCYNSEKYLRETLDSLVNQTYKDWELVIINDGSSDSTESIIKEYINKGHPIIYHYQENHGLGYSRNEALQRSQGEYIAFIDHDDIWLPEKLEKQIPLFERNERVGLVFCDGFYFNDRSSRQMYRKKKPPRGMVFRELFSGYFLCLPTVIIRKDFVFGLTEWFDEMFQMTEEADVFLRLAYMHEVDYVNEPLVMYRVHENSYAHNSYQLFSIEFDLILQKFRAINKEFDFAYSKEIKIYKYNCALIEETLAMRFGDVSRCRSLLLPHILMNYKVFVKYMLTYLGGESYLRVMRWLEMIRNRDIQN